MSKLEDQLKELQTKKLKSDFFKYLKGSLNDLKFEENRFDDVKSEVMESMNAFIDAQIDMIESGEINQKQELEELFNSEEVKVLKLMASKALNKQTNNPLGEPRPQVVLTKEQRIAELTANDPVKFALRHRHLEGKSVQFTNQDGTFNGKVVGLNAPNIILEMPSGNKVQVHVDQIIQ